jgi:hypothetical protein
MTVPAVFWPGSGSDPFDKTSLGIYEDDDAFIEDAPRVAAWIAGRLGYPVMQVEMTDAQLYDCFEESITEYSSQINEFNMRENMLALQGQSTGSSVTQRLIRGSPLPFVIEISEQYGTEAGVGGNVDWKKGYVNIVAGQQEYDLQALWGDVTESGNRIEIRRVFHERTPAISRGGFGFGDVGVGPNDGTNNLLGEFGWAGYDGGLNGFAGAATTGQFLVMPVFETLLRTQAIEFNDIVRRSQFSFELINNKIKLFPPPQNTDRMWFQYLVKADRYSSSIDIRENVISDYSNAPYSNIKYQQINDVGKRWIRKYALALAKATLGRILSKYETIPVPNQNVRMDGPQLRAESDREIEVLHTQLRETLEQTGKKAQMEREKEIADNAQEILAKAPLTIYIG